MKRILYLFITISLISCSKNSVKPASELIQKQWIANIIKENDLAVFTKGATNNIRQGYLQFKLNLSAGLVNFTEFDGTTFSGQWEISADEKTLILTNLNPQPTDTNGQIEFTINSISETSLILTRVTTNKKTGNTISTYELIVQ